MAVIKLPAAFFDKFSDGFTTDFAINLAADSETDFTRFVFCKKCGVSVEVRVIKW